MGTNPRIIGDNHVKSVYQALVTSLKQLPIEDYPKTVKETAAFINGLYPEIESVASKFGGPNPDQSKDITLQLKNSEMVSLNLFLIKKGGRIQPKNPGAKSFLAKYFLSEELQRIFNRAFEENYLEFLKELVEEREGTYYDTEKKELKKLVSDYFPKFTEEINLYRDKFLFNLRESCFSLIKDFYNEKSAGFFHAFKAFFMAGDVNIITSYGKGENDVRVEEFAPGKPRFDDIQIYKTGRSTVGIRFGEVALTLRFKFESSPSSSIKLAASYHQFPEEQEIENINGKTIKKLEELISSHVYIPMANSSNAIGKCHEAYAYYYFLKEFPSVSQVDPNECANLMGTYSSALKPEVLEKLHKSTSTIVPAITDKLNQKYGDYTIESIELIPGIYVSDRLNTGDLQLILKMSDGYVTEDISLKAMAKKSGKITTKNPGIGTILGPTYFNAGNMDSIVREVKFKFQSGVLSRTGSLEAIAKGLGLQLNGATQEQLKKGIESLLGKAMMAVTFYEEGISYCKEHSKIDSPVEVLINMPTPIQNTLAWNSGLEKISLRVKFSKGQQHGWSTVKLASEYELKKPD